MEPTIYILSQPIRSGKSTNLLKWVATQNNIGGILSPDIEGKRMIYSITSNKYIPFEVSANEKEAVQIGRFFFSAEAFETAKTILQNDATKDLDLLIIDEIGKLEISEQKGFEPVVTEIIKKFQATPTITKLLLVIRDTLLEEAIKHYHLQNASVVDLDFFKE